MRFIKFNRSILKAVEKYNDRGSAESVLRFGVLIFKLSKIFIVSQKGKEASEQTQGPSTNFFGSSGG